MEKRINAIFSVCYHHIHNIGCTRPYVMIHACKLLACALATSWLDLGNIVLRGLPSFWQNVLQGVQNSRAWLVTQTHKCEHITPVKLVYSYKALHGTAPQCLDELDFAHHLTRSPRSESEALLTISQTRGVNCGNRYFEKAAATLWNNFPVNIRKCKTLDGFTKKVKINTFISAFLA